MRFWPSLGTTAVRCGYITGDDDADPTGLVHRLVPIIGRWDIGSPPSILSSRPIRSRWMSSTARPEPCGTRPRGIQRAFEPRAVREHCPLEDVDGRFPVRRASRGSVSRILYGLSLIH